MDDARALDLKNVDRDVERAWTALTRWRRAVADSPTEHAGDNPFESLRWVAGKTTWDALGELSPSIADVPLRDALRGWIIALTQGRIGVPDEGAVARAAADASGRYAGEPPRLVSWREAWRGASDARTARGVNLWLEAASDVASRVGDARRKRAARQVEVARRFGLTHPWDALVPVPTELLRGAALRLLRGTQDLSRAVWKTDLAEDGGVAEKICGAVAREAGDGWPARLSARWLEEVFAAGRPAVALDLAALPSTLGASSFARALYAFGFAVRIGPSRSTSFAVGREPAHLEAHRLGFVFSALVVDPEWQVRALGVGRRSALAQARLLARTALFDARLHAARILLGDPSHFAARDAFDELGPLLFDRPLDARWRGAWPVARDDEPGRFIALLLARAEREALRDRFDADWFRNPRAWQQLRGLSAGPAREPFEGERLDAEVTALVGAFEAALG